jgi:N-acylneuraminate cytidylyltransferase
MTRYALIPARGGSKRIPKKNIRNFCGKPLISWSIDTALKSKLFESVIVSTDDEEIALIAEELGAEVPFFRPQRLSTDYVGTSEVVDHFLGWCETERKLPEYLCCLYPTAPFISVETLTACFELLVEKNAHSSLMVTTFAYPVWRALRKDSNEMISFQWEDYRYSRSQDLPSLFHDAGQCYWLSVASFRENPQIFGNTTFGYRLPRWQAQDIDTLEDWEMAERLFSIERRHD